MARPRKQLYRLTINETITKEVIVKADTLTEAQTKGMDGTPSWYKYSSLPDRTLELVATTPINVEHHPMGDTLSV